VSLVCVTKFYPTSVLLASAVLCPSGEVYTGFCLGNMRKRDHLGERRRWENNIKMDFQEVGCERIDCFYLAQNRDRWRALVNAVINVRVP
jgi:hypothetical protein